MRIIPQGCSFISRLLHLASSVPNLEDIISLVEGCLSYLKFWSRLLDQRDGIMFLYDVLINSCDSLKFFLQMLHLPLDLEDIIKGNGLLANGLSFPKLNSSSAVFKIYTVACLVWRKLWKANASQFCASIKQS